MSAPCIKQELSNPLFACAMPPNAAVDCRLLGRSSESEPEWDHCRESPSLHSVFLVRLPCVSRSLVDPALRIANRRIILLYAIYPCLIVHRGGSVGKIRVVVVQGKFDAHSLARPGRSPQQVGFHEFVESCDCLAVVAAGICCRFVFRLSHQIVSQLHDEHRH